MKSCVCDMCGVVVYVERPQGLILHPGVSAEELLAIAELAEFDLLAGKMYAHILERHPNHAREMSAVAYLAGKVYAMTWCNSAGDEFATLRKTWRKTFLTELAKERTQAAAPDDISTSEPPADPDGSYEKKSERNDSI